MTHSSQAAVSKGTFAASCCWAQFVHSSCTSLCFYVTGPEKTLPKDSVCMTLLTVPLAAASLCPALSSRCVLRIETSFKMARWDQFPGHRQEDRGIKEVRRATGVSSQHLHSLCTLYYCSSWVSMCSSYSIYSVCVCGRHFWLFLTSSNDYLVRIRVWASWDR